MIRESIIKNYQSIDKAYEDTERMKLQGFIWFSGWYEIEGYSVEFIRYIRKCKDEI